MISAVELQRIFSEWRIRLSRAREILQPKTWDQTEWRQFAQALALMVRDHGRSWIIDPNVYWDLRWKLQDGGELVCQIEHTPGEKTSLVVAQNGGFAESVGSYTWLWAEFNMEGNFARDPYWVEGTWKDALTALLLPLDQQAGFLLAGRAETPDALLLQDGARPNDNNGVSLLPGISEAAADVTSQYKTLHTEERNGVHVVDVKPEAPPEAQAEGTAEPTSTEFVEKPTPVEAPTDAVIVEHSELSAPAPESDAAAPTETPSEPNTTPEEAARVDTAEPFAIRWGMPQKLTWKDTDEIAYSLIDAHPDQDPLKLSLPKLHKLVIELEDFGDDPDKSNEAVLEAILMAWHEEVK